MPNPDGVRARLDPASGVWIDSGLGPKDNKWCIEFAAQKPPGESSGMGSSDGNDGTGNFEALDIFKARPTEQDMTRPSFQPGQHQTSDGRRFAVVIPVFNHHGTVAGVVRKAREHGFPVVVVDDGSTDATYDNIQSIRDIHVVRHPRNLGKGAALVTGMQAASQHADWAICLDADGQHDPRQMDLLMGAIPNHRRPIVIGMRQDMARAPWTSRSGRQFSNFWVWVSSGILLADSQSGYRIYPLPEILELEVAAQRYQYEVEVLAKAAWQGIPIIEVPVGVSYYPDGPRISHFHPWRDFVRNSKTFSRLIVKRVFSPRLWRSGRTTRNP
jgi:glycosyltransferase involved in cell wall biosynthesis